MRRVHEAIIHLLDHITISQMAGESSLCGPEAVGKNPFAGEAIESLHVLLRKIHEDANLF